MTVFDGYRTAGRIRAAVREAQAEYAARMAACCTRDTAQSREAAAAAADDYVRELAFAADHLDRYPRLAAMMDLGALTSPRRIDAHIQALRETAARWRAEVPR